MLTTLQEVLSETGDEKINAVLKAAAPLLSIYEQGRKLQIENRPS